MIIRILLSVLALVFACAQIGCSSHTLGGAPEPSSDIEADLAAIEQHFNQSTSLATALKVNTEKARNDLIAGRLVAMNLRYLRFVRELNADRQFIDSAADILILSLNLTGTALADSMSKTILAAVSAAVAGSRVSIEKNFFYEKTMPALVAAMNAERRKAFIPLLKGMKLSVDDYPVASAVTDLDVYYHAGTLIGAVNAVAAEAGEQEKAANARIAQLQELQGFRSRVLAWIEKHGAASARDALKRWYSSLPQDKFRYAAIILDRAVMSLPGEKVADALVDQTKRVAVLKILVTEVPDKTSPVIEMVGDPSIGFDVSKLIDVLDKQSLAEILAADALPRNVIPELQ